MRPKWKESAQKETDRLVYSRIDRQRHQRSKSAKKIINVKERNQGGEVSQKKSLFESLMLKIKEIENFSHNKPRMAELVDSEQLQLLDPHMFLLKVNYLLEMYKNLKKFIGSHNKCFGISGASLSVMGNLASQGDRLGRSLGAAFVLDGLKKLDFLVNFFETQNQILRLVELAIQDAMTPLEPKESQEPSNSPKRSFELFSGNPEHLADSIKGEAQKVENLLQNASQHSELSKLIKENASKSAKLIEISKLMLSKIKKLNKSIQVDLVANPSKPLNITLKSSKTEVRDIEEIESTLRFKAQSNKHRGLLRAIGRGPITISSFRTKDSFAATHFSYFKTAVVGSDGSVLSKQNYFEYDMFFVGNFLFLHNLNKKMVILRTLTGSDGDGVAGLEDSQARCWLRLVKQDFGKMKIGRTFRSFQLPSSSFAENQKMSGGFDSKGGYYDALDGTGDVGQPYLAIKQHRTGFILAPVVGNLETRRTAERVFEVDVGPLEQGDWVEDHQVVVFSNIGVYLVCLTHKGCVIARRISFEQQTCETEHKIDLLDKIYNDKNNQLKDGIRGCSLAVYHPKDTPEAIILAHLSIADQNLAHSTIAITFTPQQGLDMKTSLSLLSNESQRKPNPNTQISPLHALSFIKASGRFAYFIGAELVCRGDLTRLVVLKYNLKKGELVEQFSSSSQEVRRSSIYSPSPKKNPRQKEDYERNNQRIVVPGTKGCRKFTLVDETLLAVGDNSAILEIGIKED